MFCISDFEKFARTHLDRNAWGYYSSGANKEQTLRDNEQAFFRFARAPFLYAQFSLPISAVGIDCGHVC